MTIISNFTQANNRRFSATASDDEAKGSVIDRGGEGEEEGPVTCNSDYAN